jgi:hypothetical protein
MPDCGELRARLAVVEAELNCLVLPVTMHSASSIDVTRYHELYRERESLLQRIRVECDEHEESNTTEGQDQAEAEAR